MLADYSISVDPTRDLVKIRLAGFFTEDAIARFLEDRRVAFQQLRCGRNQHLSLTDVRDMSIQTQGMVQSFHAILSDPAYRSRRLGFIVKSTLARMQLKRAIGGRDAEVFLDPVEAERWVLAARLSDAA